MHRYTSSLFILDNMLLASQRGFISGRDNTTNLASIMMHSFAVLWNRGQIDVRWYALTKAFHLVDHVILLSQNCWVWVFRSARLSGSWIVWETGVAVINMGTPIHIYTAAPFRRPSRGCSWASSFNFCANNICSCIPHSLLPRFANDMNIFAKIPALSDCFDLQEHVNSISKWCSIKITYVLIRQS